MTRDEIAILISETAPRYMSWGIEAHFQLFAERLIQIEREACARICDEVASQLDWLTALRCAEAIRARVGATGK